MIKLITTTIGALVGLILAAAICTLEHELQLLPVVTALYMILYGLLGYYIPYIVSLVRGCIDTVQQDIDKDAEGRSLHGDYYDAIKEEQDKKDKLSK